jgi:hypothetical protein
VTGSRPGLNKLLADWNSEEPDWFELASVPAADYAQRLAGDLQVLFEVRPDPSNGYDLDETQLDPALSFCEMCILHLNDLALICFERVNEPEQIFWPVAPEKKGTFHLQVFAINLANSLAGVRHLILAGFDTQARVVLRQFIELADALLACAAAEDFFDAYRGAEPDPDQAFRYWQRHLKPARVRDILARVDAALGAPPRVQHVAADIRRETYKWCSNFAHIHPLGLTLSGIARARDAQGRLVPKFGGARDESCRTTLSKASTYAWFTVVALLRLLSDPIHGWFALLRKKDTTRAEFTFRSELLKRYYLVQYAELHRSPEDGGQEPAD